MGRPHGFGSEASRSAGYSAIYLITCPAVPWQVVFLPAPDTNLAAYERSAVSFTERLEWGKVEHAS